MGVMRKAESGVERAFQGMFGRRSSVNVKPVELAHKLVKEMEDGRVAALSRVYVPHEFVVYLCPRDWVRYEPHQEALARQLQNHLLQHARKEGYSMHAAPAVRLKPDRDLKQGQFGIGVGRLGPLPPDHGGNHSPRVAPVSAVPTRAMEPVSAPPDSQAPEYRGALGGMGREPEARVSLRQGRRVQEYSRSRVLIGRADEVDFRVDDPNVSRRHAVLLWDRGRLYVRDLGSTNGTYLNGRVVTSAPVRFGDVISVGSTQITVESN